VDSVRGQLLVASPSLLDPNFRRTVVLIAEHGDEGAMGLVLNRRLETSVAEAAPPLAEIVDDGAALHSGGPVQPTSVVVLAEFDDPDQAGALVLDNIGFVGADTDFETLPLELGRARVYAGFAGWAAGQLESEIERDDWILAPASAEDIFCDASDELWSEVLQRKGGQFALIARMPLDPSVN
jgi:putative transcriptional regulator